MKSLFNKITKNIILPLAVVGGIFSGVYGQRITNSPIPTQTHLNFAEFIQKEDTIHKKSKNIRFTYRDTAYDCLLSYNPSCIGMSITVGFQEEQFQDFFANGIVHKNGGDFYNVWDLTKEGRMYDENANILEKADFKQFNEIQKKYEFLITNIPKYYAESKKTK